jgi:hypothetical protein
MEIDRSIDPLLLVFSEQAIAAHDKSLEESIPVDRLAHVLGRGGAKVASRAVNRRNDFLMESD